MPTLIKLGKLKIQIFADDHNPPHFHVVTPDHEALIRIEDLGIHRGSMDRRSLETALAWARQNKEVLENGWKRFNS